MKMDARTGLHKKTTLPLQVHDSLQDESDMVLMGYLAF